MDSVSSNLDHQSWLLGKRFSIFRWDVSSKEAYSYTSYVKFVTSYSRFSGRNFTNSRYRVDLAWEKKNRKYTP